MSLYHPMTKNITSRVDCLTPQDDFYLKLSKHIPTTPKESLILSPPLSPYISNPPSYQEKSYIDTKLNFKLENHLDYKLTINAWQDVGKNYKSSVKNFINQYNIISSVEVTVPKRQYNRKRLQDFDVDYDRMKTRRKVRESSDEDSSCELPKRAKKPKPAAPSLAVQQQLLIDESIPDYSPDPQSTLPANNVKALKIEWKGQPMDLSQDENLNKLHPAEVVLASILRLPGNVYLDSKRRLFFEKVSRMKLDKQFRRTDAQKACRIDVNKASRLFAAFEKVGWLKDEHFEKYI